MVLALLLAIFTGIAQNCVNNALDVDLATRAYHQIAVKQLPWRKYAKWTPEPSVPARMRGDLDRDTLGVGIFTHCQAQAAQVCVVWKDDDHPMALLSERYTNETKAVAAMNEIAAVLGIPALGFVD